MNRTTFAVTLLASLCTAPAVAGPLEDRIELLDKQLRELSQQVAVLRSALARDAGGNVSFKAAGTRTDSVGSHLVSTVVGNASSTVGVNATVSIGTDALTSIGGDHAFKVGKSMVTKIGGFRSIEVAKDDVLKVSGQSTTSVGGNMRTTVGGDASHQVSGNMGVTVSRAIAIEAGDQILFRVGSASMLMRKDGSITINGTVINIKGSGDIVIKGSKVLTN